MQAPRPAFSVLLGDFVAARVVTILIALVLAVVLNVRVRVVRVIRSAIGIVIISMEVSPDVAGARARLGCRRDVGGERWCDRDLIVRELRVTCGERWVAKRLLVGVDLDIPL